MLATDVFLFPLLFLGFAHMLNRAVCINNIGLSEMPTEFFSPSTMEYFFLYTKDSDVLYILQSSCILSPDIL